jgi:hypothetical protein
MKVLFESPNAILVEFHDQPSTPGAPRPFPEDLLRRALRHHYVAERALSSGGHDLDYLLRLAREEEQACRRNGAEGELARTLGNQALILKARGDLAGAMELLRQQEEISRRLNDPDGVHRSLSHQAAIRAQQGKPPPAA